MRSNTKNVVFKSIPFLLFLASSVSAAGNGLDHAPGVADDSILYYAPNIPGAIVFAALYYVASVFLFINTYAWKDWWGLALPIGAFVQATGFIFRIPYRSSPGSIGLYIIQDLFIVLSPAAYFAFNYALFGRTAQALTKFFELGKNKNLNLTLIPARLMSTVFVISDVTTFLIQAGGGSMQTSTSLATIGSNIFLAGIILQFASYIIFLLIVVRAHWICWKKLGATRPQVLGQVNLPSINKLMLVLYFSSVWIIVRSVYRTIELAQGFRGTLITNEIYFFTLDSLPLLLAILIYIPFYPSSLYPISNKFSAHEHGRFIPMWDLNRQKTPLLSRTSSSKESLA